MPSHPILQGFAECHIHGGSPWKFDRWMQITSVKHGLFPTDDSLLPRGWTRPDANNAYTFMSEYVAQPEDKRYHFAKHSPLPGRIFLTSWLNKSWAKWSIHSIIVQGLKDKGVHPHTILRLNGYNTLGDHNWPKSDRYIPVAVDHIGLLLFGEEAFEGGSILPEKYRTPLTWFIQKSWGTIRVKLSADYKAAPQVRADMETGFQALKIGEVTREKLNVVLRAVGRWRNFTDALGTDNMRAEAEKKRIEITEYLERAKDQLSQENNKGKAKANSQKKGATRSSVATQPFAMTEDEVDNIERVYDEIFAPLFENEQLLEDDDPLMTLQNVVSDDLGMESEGNLPYDELCTRLSFRNAQLPFQFNTLRHTANLTAYSNPTLFTQTPLPHTIVDNKLHWHQLSGIHSLVRNIFSEDKMDRSPRGMLIADEVGLGKTALTLGFLGFLNQAIMMQSRDTPVPPVLQKFPYLSGSRHIPELPHLIVVPGTLESQWLNALQVQFTPGSVDILNYDGAKGFWGPEGTLQKSHQKPNNIIVLMTLSTLSNEFRDAFHPVPNDASKSKLNPWEYPMQRNDLSSTVFGHQWLTVSIDEAHNLRNPGPRHLAALRLLDQARIRLVLTATPLHTGPKDIMAMGRLLGAPYFFTKTSLIAEKAHASEERKAKAVGDDGSQLRLVRVKTARRLQNKLQGRILRRSPQSLDANGNCLLELPPLKILLGVLQLTLRETQFLAAVSNQVKALVNAGNETEVLMTKKFYLEYRLAVGCARKETSDPLPEPKTLEEWEPVKSTKVDVTGRLCQHYTLRDDVPDVKFENGKPIFPPIPPLSPGETPQRKRRILIYCEFPSMTPLLQRVLRLYGVGSLSIDGKTPMKMRDKIISQFHDPNSEERVLIFSSVGGAGLNLSIADIVIFFDQPWSAQDERQIIGRAHRQGQLVRVIVIHLLADDSADLLMNSVARSKKEMFDAFIERKLGRELRDLLAGRVLESGLEVEEEERREKEAKKETKRRGSEVPKPSRKQKKQKPLIESDNEHGRGELIPSRSSFTAPSIGKGSFDCSSTHASASMISRPSLLTVSSDEEPITKSVLSRKSSSSSVLKSAPPRESSPESIRKAEATMRKLIDAAIARSTAVTSVSKKVIAKSKVALRKVVKSMGKASSRRDETASSISSSRLVDVDVSAKPLNKRPSPSISSNSSLSLKRPRRESPIPSISDAPALPTTTRRGRPASTPSIISISDTSIVFESRLPLETTSTPSKKRPRSSSDTPVRPVKQVKANNGRTYYIHEDEDHTTATRTSTVPVTENIFSPGKKRTANKDPTPIPSDPSSDSIPDNIRMRASPVRSIDISVKTFGTTISDYNDVFGISPTRDSEDIRDLSADSPDMIANKPSQVTPPRLSGHLADDEPTSLKKVEAWRKDLDAPYDGDSFRLERSDPRPSRQPPAAPFINLSKPAALRSSALKSSQKKSEIPGNSAASAPSEASKRSNPFRRQDPQETTVIPQKVFHGSAKNVQGNGARKTPMNSFFKPGPKPDTTSPSNMGSYSSPLSGKGRTALLHHVYSEGLKKVKQKRPVERLLPKVAPDYQNMYHAVSNTPVASSSSSRSRVSPHCSISQTAGSPSTSCLTPSSSSNTRAKVPLQRRAATLDDMFRVDSGSSLLSQSNAQLSATLGSKAGGKQRARSPVDS